MAVAAGQAAYGLPPAPIDATLNELMSQLSLTPVERKAFECIQRLIQMNKKEHGAKGSSAFAASLAKLARLSDCARAAAVAGAAAVARAAATNVHVT